MQQAQDRERQQPQGAAAVDEGHAPGGGGWCRIACRETEKGSASTGGSSLDPSSGIGMHCDSWAGSSGAMPPVAWLLLPWWMPGVDGRRA